MCGIHLIWGKLANEQNLQLLLDESAERGPDQQMVFSPWPGLWVGVNRLRISDTSSAADQPFWTEDEHAFLIYNGELYNAPELKSLLQTMGQTFKTNSDTEVLLAWLRTFGDKGMSKLKGMYAFLLVNVVTKSILVARDPNGEKPLYFKQGSGSLCISSSAKGLARVVGANLDWESLENYAYLRAPRQGHTFFHQVKAWKPNRYSHISNPTTFRFDYLPKDLDENKASFERFEEVLKAAVERQFQADVPLGMLLSGGADSSLLYAKWYALTGRPLPAYTFEVEKSYRASYPDTSYVDQLRKKFPFEQHQVPVTQEIFLEHWESYLSSLDQPVGDSAGFILWMLARKAAKQGTKVLISGAGADELWGGYRRHEAFAKYLRYKVWWLRLKPLMLRLPLPRVYSKFFQSILSDEQHTFLNFSALKPVSNELYQDIEREFKPTFSPVKRMLNFDRKIYLVEDLLKIQDQSLMAHAVEGRSPYLDADFIALWKNVNEEELLLGKPWVHQSLSRLGLDEITGRDKLGLGLPLAEWFAEQGPFARRAFASIRDLAVNFPKDLPPDILAIAKNPERHVRHEFLLLYNLFLLSDWANLQRS
ncbi:asparagine synthase (glutamine-hydrolyzing) [Algoriphagus namhaensis]